MKRINFPILIVTFALALSALFGGFSISCANSKISYQGFLK